MPDFISAVTVNPSWTNITANSGLDVNKPLRVFNLGIEQIRWAVSATSPAIDEKDGNWLDIGGDLVIPPNTTVWMACVSGSRVSVQYAENFALESALRSYPNLTQPKLQTATITNAESFALLGIEYRLVITFTGVPAGGARWMKFQPPVDREVAISSRTLSPNIAGATYRLYTGSTGWTPTNTATAYNQSDRASQQTALSTIQWNSTAPTTLGTDKGIILRSGAGTVAGGSGRQSGTAAPEQGFTIYQAGGAGFFAEVKNTATAPNDIDVIITFAEIPASIAS
jgi:hypothetical protein